MTEQNEAFSATRTALHWNAHALRWANLGRPLRPSPEDIRVYEAEAAELAATLPSLKALLLGVTPEIACMDWPLRSMLIAADHAIGMVEGVWPREEVKIPALAVVSEWRRLPLADASMDYVAGDGSFNSLDAVASQERLSRELMRVLRPGGRLAIRVYARPDPPQLLSSVFEDLSRNRIRTFDAFKLRLLMAVPANADGSVPLEKVWNAWAEAALDPIQLSAQSGWPLASINTIDAYRGNPGSYSFLTLADFRRAMERNFVEVAAYAKSYELGSLCPTLVFQPRRD